MISAIVTLLCWGLLIGFVAWCAWKDVQDRVEHARARAEYFQTIDRLGRP